MNDVLKEGGLSDELKIKRPTHCKQSNGEKKRGKDERTTFKKRPNFGAACLHRFFLHPFL